jgi:DNA-binding MarR family transcriptional regulator
MKTIRLVNFLNSLRRLPPLSEVSGDEERMLFELRELWERTGALAIEDIYRLIESQSPSTSYRQLMALKDKGLVDVAICENDRRRRVVTFTKASEKLFRAFQ